MNGNALKQVITNSDSEVLSEALLLMLNIHTTPVFGAAKAIEHEVAAFLALQCLGFISEQPDDYELVMKLRVTKAKARNLLYQVALRRDISMKETDQALRQLLSQPRVTKEGDKILIEVADPFLMDSLKQRVRSLNFISDGSFSGSIAKLPTRALTALIEDLIPKKERPLIKRKLREQGVRGDDFNVIIGSVLGTLGKRVAGQIGEKAAEQIGDKIADFFAIGTQATFDWIKKGSNN